MGPLSPQHKTKTQARTTPQMTVPETLKKYQARKAASAKRFLAASKAKKARNAALKLKALQRAEKYSHEYRKSEQRKIKLNRTAKSQGNIFVPEEPKVAFVIRIRGINGVAPRTKKILQLLRLRQIHNG